jgi:hypothetical protein
MVSYSLAFAESCNGTVNQTDGILLKCLKMSLIGANNGVFFNDGLMVKIMYMKTINLTTQCLTVKNARISQLACRKSLP